MPKDNLTSIAPEYENLRIALDSNQIKERLDDKLPRFLGENISIESIEVTRTFPVQDGSFLIQYQLTIKDAEKSEIQNIFLFGHLFTNWQSQYSATDYPKNNSMVFEGLQMVIPVFPYDPKLPHLPLFLKSREIAGMLKLILMKQDKSGPNIADISHQILGYRLKSRCVIRYQIKYAGPAPAKGKDRTIIAKIYRPGRSEEAAGIINFLCDNGFKNVPGNELVATNLLSPDSFDNALFIEPGPGNQLHSLLSEPILKNGCKAAASILKKLHSLTSDSLPTYNYNNELENLDSKTALFGNIFPELKKHLEQHLDFLIKKQETVSKCAFKVCSHRDFYDKQVIFSNKKTTLIDCDNMVMADPALDYGNFLAHLILRRLQYPQFVEYINDGARNFIETYKYLNEEFENRVNWWKSATLLRLILLYSLRPQWQRIVPEIVNQSKTIWQE